MDRDKFVMYSDSRVVLQTDGRTLSGRVSQAGGGVGRNIADCLGKLASSRPLLVTALGQDQHAKFILDGLQHIDRSGVEEKAGARTASYTTIIDSRGETRFGVGDMEIHSTISTETVEKHKLSIKSSSMLILDGNLPTKTITAALDVASHTRTFTWFEPTDLSKATRPFATPLWKNLTFVSPNLNELKEMAKHIGFILPEEFNFDCDEKLIQQVKYLAMPLAEVIPLVMVTMGSHGLMLVSRAEANEPVISSTTKPAGEIHARYYKPLHLPNIENTSGAGDCTAAGFVTAVLGGLSEGSCIKAGLEAGRAALLSNKPVPESFNPSA